MLQPYDITSTAQFGDIVNMSTKLISQYGTLVNCVKYPTEAKTRTSNAFYSPIKLHILFLEKGAKNTMQFRQTAI